MEKKKPFFGKKGHQEKTADKCMQCANAYRAERNFVRSGEMYYKAALMYKELDEKPAAAKAATDSAKMYAKDPTRHVETMKSLHLGVDLYKDQKKKMQAADLLSDLAKILAEEGQPDKSIEVMKEAVELYKEDKSDAKAASVLEGIADMLSEKQQYVQAADLYYQVSMVRLQSSLTQGSSGPMFFKSMLCTLQANDIVAAKRKIEEYLNTNPAWRPNQDCKFLYDLIEKIEGRNVEEFDEIVRVYKNRSTCDKWTQNVLLDLRKYADSEEGDQLL